jgi:hypothetical protein
MTSTRRRWYRSLYLTATVYDVTLGLVFLFMGGWAFEKLGIGDEIPDGGYVPLIGASLLVIGIASWFISRGVQRNLELIAVGTVSKLAYGAVAVWVFTFGDLPHVVFLAAFGVVDVIFFVLMAECWRAVRGLRKTEVDLQRILAHV